MFSSLTTTKNYVLIYLASSAAVAMSILTILKYILFRTLKDNAILLDGEFKIDSFLMLMIFFLRINTKLTNTNYYYNISCQYFYFRFVRCLNYSVSVSYQCKPIFMVFGSNIERCACCIYGSIWTQSDT